MECTLVLSLEDRRSSGHSASTSLTLRALAFSGRAGAATSLSSSALAARIPSSCSSVTHERRWRDAQLFVLTRGTTCYALGLGLLQSHSDTSNAVTVCQHITIASELLQWNIFLAGTPLTRFISCDSGDVLATAASISGELLHTSILRLLLAIRSSLSSSY